MTNSLILGEIDISPLLKAKNQLDLALKTAQSPLEKTGTIKSEELFDALPQFQDTLTVFIKTISKLS